MVVGRAVPPHLSGPDHLFADHRDDFLAVHVDGEFALDEPVSRAVLVGFPVQYLHFEFEFLAGADGPFPRETPDLAGTHVLHVVEALFDPLPDSDGDGVRAAGDAAAVDRLLGGLGVGVVILRVPLAGEVDDRLLAQRLGAQRLRFADVDVLEVSHIFAV